MLKSIFVESVIFCIFFRLSLTQGSRSENENNLINVFTLLNKPVERQEESKLGVNIINKPFNIKLQNVQRMENLLDSNQYTQASELMNYNDYRYVLSGRNNISSDRSIQSGLEKRVSTNIGRMTNSQSLGDIGHTTHNTLAGNLSHISTPKKTFLSTYLSNSTEDLLEVFLNALLMEGKRLLKNLEMRNKNSTSDGTVASGKDSSWDESASTNESAFVGKITENFAKQRQLLVEGRKKADNSGMMMMAGALSAGTVLLFSLMGISAMAAKAIVTSVIALALALLSSLKGHEKGTTYEVHAKPYFSQEHTHSSELQHGHHGYK